MWRLVWKLVGCWFGRWFGRITEVSTPAGASTISHPASSLGFGIRTCHHCISGWGSFGGVVLVEQIWGVSFGGAFLVGQCWWGVVGGVVFLGHALRVKEKRFKDLAIVAVDGVEVSCHIALSPVFCKMLLT